jgi:hypothetical protein
VIKVAATRADGIVGTRRVAGKDYADLGHDYYTRRVDPDARKKSLIAQLEELTGHKIAFVDGDTGEIAA